MCDGDLLKPKGTYAKYYFERFQGKDEYCYQYYILDSCKVNDIFLLLKFSLKCDMFIVYNITRHENCYLSKKMILDYDVIQHD